MKIKFEDSLFYQIKISEKFFRTLFEQFFKELNLGISAIEHLALDIISQTPNCCQRDLARIILKDRAGTGKLACSLENKGLIKIELKTKHNKPVRILSITDKGREILKKTNDITKTISQKIQKRISHNVIEETRKTLKEFREIVKDAMINKI